MNTIKISRDLGISKYIMLVLGLSFSIYLIFVVRDFGVVLLGIALGIATVLYYYLRDSASAVEYDGSNLFISNRNKTRVVDIQNVTTIKLTMLKDNSNNLWKIKYFTNGRIISVRMLPDNAAFENFKIDVCRKNPAIKIVNFSHSLDFDM
jgi:hypothetical protein